MRTAATQSVRGDDAHENVLAGTMQAHAVVVVAVLGWTKGDFDVLGQARTYEAVVCDVKFKGGSLRGKNVDALLLVTLVDDSNLEEEEQVSDEMGRVGGHAAVQKQ